METAQLETNPYTERFAAINRTPDGGAANSLQQEIVDRGIPVGEQPNVTYDRAETEHLNFSIPHVGNTALHETVTTPPFMHTAAFISQVFEHARTAQAN